LQESQRQQQIGFGACTQHALSTMEHMRCNKCAAQMAPQSVCIAASCNHLFCKQLTCRLCSG
jgi:hypothetical protein